SSRRPNTEREFAPAPNAVARVDRYGSINFAIDLRALIAAKRRSNFCPAPTQWLMLQKHAPVTKSIKLQQRDRRSNKQQTNKTRSVERFNYWRWARRDKMIANASEPAKRISPITLQALIPTTRRLAWLRPIEVYRKSPLFALPQRPTCWRSSEHGRRS